MILAANKAAPLRFLIVVTIGWVSVRGLMISGWSPDSTPETRWSQGPSWLDRTMQPWRTVVSRRVWPVVTATRTLAAPPARRGISFGHRPIPGGPWRVGAPIDAVTMQYLALVGYDQPNRTYYARATAAQEAAAAIAADAMPPLLAARRRSRWSGAGWAFVRGGGYATPLSPAGQIGAGQAGVRVLYRLATGISASARISRTIGGPDQTEAAAGIDWQPAPHVPVHLTVERRVAIDRGGRDAFALGAAGGVYAVPLAPGWRLDGYAEAGVVGARRRDLYADGALRAGRALDLGDGRSLTLGLGAWGAAQPRAARLDAGPSAVLRLPVDGRTIAVALDYRARLAGDARPHSGVALTVGVDF